MSFTPDEWARVRKIFEEALSLDPAFRQTHVESACGSDLELRRHVERLLDSHHAAGSGFLKSPAAADLAGAVQGPPLEGRRIGPYEISGRIGGGGMGVVYKALDVRLHRTVVLKVISPHLIDAPGARERFEREARAVGALNHPNICTLYDVGRDQGVDYLVMEHLEGETLAERLNNAALPVGRAIEYATAVARALDKAHRAGIVHRDLKPANIMLTKAGPKLLDFGVAQTRAGGEAAPAPAGAVTSAADPQLTTPGTVLGTVQYMSPEQILGRPVDARSDVFAFGAVVYEMLTGRKAFAGATQAALITAILEQDPASPSSLRTAVPLFLDRIVIRCLAKDPDERWQSMADIALALESVGTSTIAAGPVAPRLLRTMAILGWTAASALLVAGIAMIGLRPVASTRGGATRLSLLPPDGTVFLGGNSAPYLALSPDGSTLAFVPTPAGGRARIWIRALDSLKPIAAAGTDGATFPFWSPDGRSIAFFADNRLKIMDRLDAAPRVLCDAPDARGGAWSRDGLIVFAPRVSGSLYRVPASGGTPVPASSLEAGETSHRFPSFLPDGRHFLYMVQSQSRETNALVVGSLDSAETRRLPIVESRAEFADGFLVFDRDRSLTVQRFDPATLTLSGQPVSMGDRVGFRMSIQGDAPFSVAANGALAYWDGDVPLNALRWFDRSGHPLSALGAPAQYSSIDLSRDGTRVAAEVFDLSTQTADIWAIDTATGIPTRLTAGTTVNWNPIWSPDGSKFVFGSIKKGGPSLVYLQNARSDATAEPLFDSTDFVGPTDWPGDGSRILIQDLTVFKTGLLPMAAPRTPSLLLRSPFLEGDARLSPDGRWLAYSSTESGTWDVFVQPFPSLDRKWRLSPDGGSRPMWRRDSAELFYVSSDQKLMAVEMTPGPSFAPGVPRALFALRFFPGASTIPRRLFAVSGDGQRFLVITPIEPTSIAPATVILNWTAALKK